jgi:hypothetical protein
MGPEQTPGLGQQAPLTPEYQAIFDTSLAEQAAGGHGNDRRFTCRSSGMPRNMTAVSPSIGLGGRLPSVSVAALPRVPSCACPDQSVAPQNPWGRLIPIREVSGLPA